MSDGVQILLGVLIGYVIGMFPSADLVARVATRGTVDLRAAGSGNPGGLNAARVLGRKWGLLVIVLDTAKGTLAGFVGLALGDAGAYAAGTAVIAGHCWPVYNGFRGGKGVAAAGGSFISVFPPMLPIDGLASLAVVVVTRNSRLAIRARVAGLGGGGRRVVGRRPAHLVGSRARARTGDLRRGGCGHDPGQVLGDRPVGWPIPVGLAGHAARDLDDVVASSPRPSRRCPHRHPRRPR